MLNKNTSKGRPINPEKQKEQKGTLLNAALELLAEKSYSDITIREIATRSGVNSAMISYYFTNKEGLFIALLDRMSKKHFISMKEISRAENPIKAFITNILAMLNSNGSFARLIHNEFSSKDAALSDIFIERFPKKMAIFLPQLIKKEIGIKDDIKAKYMAFSLISMLITPFISKSIRS
jgi:AcrR family transcriptional regulator